MGFYRRHVGPRIVEFACSQARISELRRSIIPRAGGVVLEIGIGPALNLAHYDPQTVSKVIGIDPEPGFLKVGKERVKASPVPVEIIVASGEKIPLADNVVDTVVLTYTLCSVQDPLATLREIRRVLKPGGRLLFLEHGRSKDASVASWQDRFNPLWNLVSCGCQLNRDTLLLLRSAGFKVEDADHFYLPGAPKILGFHCRGVASSGAAVAAS